NFPPPGVRDTRAWLLTVAYRICMDLHRERIRRPVETLDAAEPRDLRLPIQQGAESPERAYLAKELAAVLEDAIGNLPDRLAKAMRAHLASGSYRQVARDLDITEANARKRIQQARSLLRSALADYRAGRPPSRPAGNPSHRRTRRPHHGDERHRAQ